MNRYTLAGTEVQVVAWQYAEGATAPSWVPATEHNGKLVWPEADGRWAEPGDWIVQGPRSVEIRDARQFARACRPLSGWHPLAYLPAAPGWYLVRLTRDEGRPQAFSWRPWTGREWLTLLGDVFTPLPRQQPDYDQWYGENPVCGILPAGSSMTFLEESLQAEASWWARYSQQQESAGARAP